MLRLFPRMLAVTAVVVVAPIVLGLRLESQNVITSAPVAAAISAALGVLIYHVGHIAWLRREGTGDVLFSDLLPWGYFRRGIQRRRIMAAVRVLDGAQGVSWKGAGGLAINERIRLLERLADNLEARDGYTHGHSRRVARLTGMIAAELGLNDQVRASVELAARVHDVGKLETPIEILNKLGKLTPAEFAEIERHPVTGEYIVSLLGNRDVGATVRHHHERLDGSGYPDGLHGDLIPLGARIVAVADTFDAITSTRAYRSAKPHKLALDIIRAEAGAKLDAEVVDAFFRAYHAHRPFAGRLAVAGLLQRVIGLASGRVSVPIDSTAAAATGSIALGTVALPIHDAVASAGTDYHRDWHNLEFGAAALRAAGEPGELADGVAGTVSTKPRRERPAGSHAGGGRVLSYLDTLPAAAPMSGGAWHTQADREPEPAVVDDELDAAPWASSGPAARSALGSRSSV